jgi:hypothetical protein
MNIKKDNRWQVWKNMNQRCSYQKDKKYRWYGAKGISVCERWRWETGQRKQPFLNFCQDMGIRISKDMTLDRIDFDGSYSPENCRWLPRKQNHKRYVRLTKKQIPVISVL